MPQPASKNNYWFILGREPLLSAAEIAAIFNLEKIGDFKAPILKIDSPAADKDSINRLGGTIKIGRAIGNGLNEEELSLVIEEELKTLKGKINFGLSLYVPEKTDARTVQKIGLTIKNKLKNEGLSTRFVFNDEPVLSSVSVQKNGLLEKGREFMLEKNNDKFNAAVTLSVQPFEEFGARDFGRPGRDELSGMLPPKLALMMVNLSGAAAKTVILDPFCGSGTILTEAARLGYKNLIGADLSDKAINDTKKNFTWSKLPEPRLFQCDIRDLSKKINANSVDAIITEPYLGKPLRGRETKTELLKQTTELKELYLSSFREFKKILKPGGMAVFVVPAFKVENNWLKIDLQKEIKKMGFMAQPLLTTGEQTYTSLLYARPSQHVGREIWKFKLN